MSIIEEMIFIHHPRSLLFDKHASYLDSLSISSVSSEPYLQFKHKVKSLLHCCLAFPSTDLAELGRFPYLMRKV